MKRNFLFAVLIALSIFVNTLNAQIAVRGSVTTADITTTSVSVAKPTGVVQNDIMFVNIEQSANTTTAPTCSGWTLISSAITDAGPKKRLMAVMYKIAGASKGASYTFTLGTGVNEGSAAIVAFSGVNTTGGFLVGGGAGGPFNVAPGALNVTSASPATATTITTSGSNVAVIMFVSCMDGVSGSAFSSWSTTSPGSLTELYDFDGATSAESIGAAWATKASGGSTGSGTTTLNITGMGKGAGSILIALGAGSVGAKRGMLPWMLKR